MPPGRSCGRHVRAPFTQSRKLEERLGHALFEREGRRLVLTEAGRVALGHADAIFVAGDRTARRAARDRSRPQIAAEVDDMAMMRLLARDGVGLAVLPPIVVRDELAPLPQVRESFYAVTLDRRFPNPLVGELLRAAAGGSLPIRNAGAAIPHPPLAPRDNGLYRTP